jgi:two-component system, chemotaxis family, protein-glutamate methylesterase/glutaminase
MAAIKLLLVDDSPLAIHSLKKIFSQSADITVVGTATNGQEALDLIPSLNPDVICTDYYMPVMNGLELTKKVMAKKPIPILILSAFASKNEDLIFNVVSAGAIEVFPKSNQADVEKNKIYSRDLINKIKILAGVVALKKRSHLKDSVQSPSKAVKVERRNGLRVLAVGSSTGGPNVLEAIFSKLPEKYPIPIVCAQHIGGEFLDNFVTWLNTQCEINVCVAQDRETPLPGNIYFPKKKHQLEIDQRGRFRHIPEKKEDLNCPSVNTLLLSVAKYYGSSCGGVLLTGIGSDGAKGMAEIVKNGGMTIAQSEATCTVYGMPKEAVALAKIQHIMSPEQIHDKFLSLGNK